MTKKKKSKFQKLEMEIGVKLKGLKNEMDRLEKFFCRLHSQKQYNLLFKNITDTKIKIR